MRFRRGTVLGAVGCALLLVVAVLLLDRVPGLSGVKPGDETQVHEQVDQATPGWAGVDLDVSSESFADLEPLGDPGQLDLDGPVLVNVWATTCAPCKDELPWLQRLTRDTEIDVIGVSRDHFALYPEEMIAEIGITYPNFLDTEAAFIERLGGRVPVMAIPATFLVQDGRAEWLHLGVFKSYRALQESVSARLNVTEPSGPS